MAAVNEAWRVLSDPGRRAEYDASLRARASTVAASPSAAPAQPEEDDADELGPDDHGPRQFWVVALPGLLVLAVLGAIFLFTAYARGGLGGSGTTVPGAPVDGVIQIGSCVALDSQARALETPCEGPHHGVVMAIVAARVACPSGPRASTSPTAPTWSASAPTDAVLMLPIGVAACRERRHQPTTNGPFVAHFDLMGRRGADGRVLARQGD